MNEGSRPTVTSNPREPGSESTGLEKKPTTMVAAFRSTRAILLACVLCLAVRYRVEPRLGTPPVLPHVFIPTTYSNADVTSLPPHVDPRRRPHPARTPWSRHRTCPVPRS